MSRSIFILFAALALLQAASAIDVSKYKNVRLDFGDNDIVPKTKLLGAGEERVPAFIGDLTLGQRYADETVFQRIVEFENPTNTVQSTTFNLSVSSGVIHYVSAKNSQGSYSVICGPSNLGTPQTSINVRVPPTSTTVIRMTIAAHSQFLRSK
ncbi:uncharacterized protein LOC116427766 [Nomia melanderi]|uniref:uncharacterized protein LOC116427766 n=1 Tax=Nomia melanderi TaxID=2448451 RepID=UPI003FCE2BE4